MKIFHGIGAVSGTFKNPVIAIGVFDGLHVGHQRLIRKVVSRARHLNGMAIVMTFNPHPAHVLDPDKHLPLLISLPYRLRLMASLGVDAVVIIRFTKKFSSLTPDQFIKTYLLKTFSPREVIVGDDFRFGQNRAGTIENLESISHRDHFHFLSIPTRKGGDKKFSSTAVRGAIAAGDLKAASRMLARPVSLLGTVVAGDRRGKIIGFPTANIIPQGEMLPPQGVYVARVKYLKKVYQGMANIGVRPSFYKDKRLNVEVHIFNFNKNIYGCEIVIEFLHKIRNEMYFPSSNDLIAQLKIDEAFSRAWFSRNEKS